MPADDLERRLSKVEESIDRIERAVVAREGARDPLNELAEHVERLIGAFDDWRAQAQERRADPPVTSVLQNMSRQTDAFLSAIRDNTAATNSLLATSDARLHQIEQELADRDGAFPADANVLAEGEFLKRQLSGIEGTERPGPMFKDAAATRGPTGFEVLADAVNEASPYYPTP